MRDDRERLLDILDAIAKIDKYAGRGRAVFASDELIQTWVINQLRIIGEAARALSESTKRRRPQVPWKKIIGMRHILVHQYLRKTRWRWPSWNGRPVDHGPDKPPQPRPPGPGRRGL